MIGDLLYILISLVCGYVTLFVSQQGLLRSIINCAALGVTFAGLLTKAIDAPTPLAVGSAIAITALLTYLGRCEHTDPNAATDQQTAQQTVIS